MARNPLVRAPKPFMRGFSSLHRAFVRLTGGRLGARHATADERARYWPQFVDLLGTYAQYQTATEREIPVVVLEPIG